MSRLDSRRRLFPINKYGIYQKEKLSYEAQAQSLLWHFTDTIEKEFFILIGYDIARTSAALSRQAHRRHW